MKLRWLIIFMILIVFVLSSFGYAVDQQRTRIESENSGMNVVAYWWKDPGLFSESKGGAVAIAGMVENTTDQIVAVVLWARYYGSDGQELTVKNRSAQIEEQRISLWEQFILPDEMGYFMHTLALSAINNDVARVSLEVEDVFEIESVTQGQITNVGVTHKETGTTVSGTFTNIGNEPCYNPVVVIVAYQWEEIMYVDRYFLPDQMELAPGEFVNFEYSIPLPENRSLKSLGMTHMEIVPACGAAG